MPRLAKASRQVTWFDDGDLWCTDDASPPVSPAGWYVRPPGTAVAWIGPFATAQAAEAAPTGGDPFAAARRRLEAWRRGSSREERAQPAMAAEEPADERGLAEGQSRPPVEPGTPRQLTLDLGESPGATVTGEADNRLVRRSRPRRRAETSQQDLPF